MSRRKGVLDLFVRGRALALPNGSYLFVRVLNSFEREEAIDAGQVARARLVMALKNRGDERMKIEARVEERGRDLMARELAATVANDKIGEYVADIQDDPEWSERMKILLDTDRDDVAKPLTQAETELLEKIQVDYFEAITKRQVEEEEYLFDSYMRMADEEFLDEYVNSWIDKKGSALARAEYDLTEVYLATRMCNATADEDQDLDHSACDGHDERFFESRQEARMAPDDLMGLLREALLDLSMSPRDPKDSASPESSSASQQSLSEAEVPKPST